MASFSESIKGDQVCGFFILWVELPDMSAPEFPMSSPQFVGLDNAIESNTVNGRKRRRKRTKPILSEEDVNVLKRKATSPVKPPVSKKTILCADFSQRPNKWVEMPEGVLEEGFEVKEEVMEESQETKEAVNILLKELDVMEEEEKRKTQTKNMEETCSIHCKPVKKHVSKNGWEYYKCSESHACCFALPKK